MVEDALILDIDIVLAEQEKKLKKIVAEKDAALSEKDALIRSLQAQLRQLQGAEDPASGKPAAK